MAPDRLFRVGAHTVAHRRSGPSRGVCRSNIFHGFNQPSLKGERSRLYAMHHRAFPNPWGEPRTARRAWLRRYDVPGSRLRRTSSSAGPRGGDRRVAWARLRLDARVLALGAQRLLLVPGALGTPAPGVPSVGARPLETE